MNAHVVDELIKQLKSLKPNKEFLPLHEPQFEGNEIKYVTDCIQTGWVSSVGSYVNDFEKKLAEFTGVKRAVAVVNGTAALHIALKIVGVVENDEVIIPSLTFVATANAVTYCGAIPHFVDVSMDTLGMDPDALEQYLNEIAELKEDGCYNKITGRRIKAVVPMHTFGHPVDLDSLIEICNKYHLVLVEDAAESLGSYYKGVHTGNFGKVAAVSFNGNKIITTGGGGAILTNDEKLADYAKHLTTTAKIPHRWEFVHDEIGYNYRMPNLNAALGCAQMEKLSDFIKWKRNVFHKYKKIIENYRGLRLFGEPQNSKSNYWLQTLVIEDPTLDITYLLEQLNDNGIMARPVWMPLHQLQPFKNCPKSNLSNTSYLKTKIVNIPSSVYMGL